MAGREDTMPPVGTLGLLCRGAAILIALAAVVDPAITSSRATQPLISLVAADRVRDSALIRQTERVLQSDFRVVRAPSSAATATVLVGDQVPPSLLTTSHSAPAVVVSPRQRGHIAVVRVQAPSFTTLDARATIVASIALHAAPGDVATAQRSASRAVIVELLDGARVVAREQHTMRVDSMAAIPLTFVPSRPGAAILQVRAFASQQADTTRTDLVIDVRDVRWSVLFFDRRPSWMSTFVRRALERDPRFAVTSRIVTSTNVSREQGRAPVSLESVAATGAFDVVAIGAPDALTTRDVEGLTTLLRTRGASVMVLADRAAPGPIDALTGTGGWRTVARRAPAQIVSDAQRDATRDTARDAIRLQGLAIGVPARTPRDAHVIARLAGAAGSSASTTAASTASATASAAGDPVIWRVPVGLGQLVVSGAFDAWRYRDSAQSTFDATWRDLTDEAARLKQAALTVEISPTLVSPRERVRVEARRRDDIGSSRPLSITWRRDLANAAPSDTSPAPAATTIRTDTLHRGHFPAPLDTGRYHVMVSDGVDTVYTPLVVAAHVARDVRDEPALTRAWAVSRGGQVVSSDSVSTVGALLREIVRPATQRITWHPMRSPWWIVPFALLLAAEWWIRRRRGLA